MLGFTTMPPIRQAGAITVRDTANGPKVLLVRAKRDPRQWIFPKGHQEKGETLAETAVRELKEEGGVVGEAVKPVGVSTFHWGDEDVEVTYFLVRDTGRRKTAEREVAWRSFADAKSLVSFDDGRWLLDKAQQILRQSPK
jgi:ADP-ribose pyrophosphatase YjhB (NUDIX family)